MKTTTIILGFCTFLFLFHWLIFKPNEKRFRKYVLKHKSFFEMTAWIAAVGFFVSIISLMVIFFFVVNSVIV